MNKLFLTVLLLVLFGLNVFSQTVKTENWNRYSWGTEDREGFSVLLPEKPKQINFSNSEEGITLEVDGVIYSASFKDDVTEAEYTNQKATFKNFKEFSLCQHNGILVSNSDSIIKLLFIDNRLYKMSIKGISSSNPLATKFIESFTLLKDWNYWKGGRQGEPSYGMGSGGGSSFESTVCKNIGNKKTLNSSVNSEDSAVVIRSKPRPNYPKEARGEISEGKVTLIVTFLADGTIGDITVSQSTHQILNDSVIEAAKLIKFKPAMKNGKPITTQRNVVYTYASY